MSATPAITSRAPRNHGISRTEEHTAPATPLGEPTAASRRTSTTGAGHGPVRSAPISEEERLERSAALTALRCGHTGSATPLDPTAASETGGPTWAEGRITPATVRREHPIDDTSATVTSRTLDVTTASDQPTRFGLTRRRQTRNHGVRRTEEHTARTAERRDHTRSATPAGTKIRARDAIEGSHRSGTSGPNLADRPGRSGTVDWTEPRTPLAAPQPDHTSATSTTTSSRARDGIEAFHQFGSPGPNLTDHPDQSRTADWTEPRTPLAAPLPDNTSITPAATSSRARDGIDALHQFGSPGPNLADHPDQSGTGDWTKPRTPLAAPPPNHTSITPTATSIRARDGIDALHQSGSPDPNLADHPDRSGTADWTEPRTPLTAPPPEHTSTPPTATTSRARDGIDALHQSGTASPNLAERPGCTDSQAALIPLPDRTRIATQAGTRSRVLHAIGIAERTTTGSGLARVRSTGPRGVSWTGGGARRLGASGVSAP
ncbi:hypothetical protein ACQEVB_09040 [Pseudonocardia sp. CA-107938]|uniref:hypothetical protein n=1 Tax=Pseudonocardia sp. CA-107938 TaxID=3240021 RepID=UPI003D93EA9D